MGTRICELCGKRLARYVCQKCARTVCEDCFEPHEWLCSECYGRSEQEAKRLEVEDSFPSFSFSTKTFFLGFILIFIGVVILMVAALVYGLPSSFGLIVFIGPFPIILGAGEYSFLAVVLAVILTVISIVFFFIMRDKKRMTFSTPNG